MSVETSHLLDDDLLETREWLDALDVVIREEGVERAKKLLGELMEHAQEIGAHAGVGLNTPYKNTISPDDEPEFPGDPAVEKRLRALMRWNAMAMVLRAVKKCGTEIGGHIATYASVATLYETGFHHFFRADSKKHLGDLVYIQGHSSPGIYARAFLEGRLSEDQLDRFRQEVEGDGLSSYPHAWLMPDFWQFATVSMGLGPLQAIYQARFLKYLGHRGLLDEKMDHENRKVWAFLGDGEMSEPESLGALVQATREGLDNLIFVVNCNLQRLDGPVNGDGKIIQELEGVYRGSGWHVIKVIWGHRWDALFKKDTSGLLLKRMEACVDGEFQAFRAHDGAYFREHFFGESPELLALVADKTDDELWQLNVGGLDPKKVYAAYKAAVEHKGQPTVILAQTIKGYGMGAEGEAKNTAHSQKKMSVEARKAFCERFNIKMSEKNLEEATYLKPANNSAEINYLQEKRKALGGYLPKRNRKAPKLTIPPLSAFEVLTNGSADREQSTTMAFVRLLSVLLKDKNIGEQVVPIVADESRTFGMEGLFRQIGIYSAVGQLYEPEDRKQVMYYRESKTGQLLQEGITESGALCSWIAAATSYSTNGVPMIPFYIYYSMFGFQRAGDLIWAAGDMRSRGFLLGGTAGRTTLAGEGLQHQDGHNHLMFSMVPNAVCYDPAYAYEVAVIMHQGLKRMFVDQEDIFFYVTLLNENYVQPPMPKNIEKGILKGMYCLKKAKTEKSLHVQLMGSGAILLEVVKAAELLEKEHNISADIWSITSFSELRRDAMAVERENRLHPTAKPKTSYIADCLKGKNGPVIAATDYIRLYADQIRGEIPQNYHVLGTDGYGRSDTRKQLRDFFEVNSAHIVIAALKALADEGRIEPKKVEAAMKKYKIQADRPFSLDV